MSEVPYENAVEILLDRFPEFLKSELSEEDLTEGAYYIWGVFGTFATNYICSLPKDQLDRDPFVSRIFELANDLMSNGDLEMQNLVVIELFENFYGHRKTLDLARRKISAEHLPWLEKQGEWLNTIKDN